MTTNLELNPPTLTDLYAREVACRTEADYSTGYEDHKRQAAAVQVSMAAYRVMPLLSWPGGPYFGAPVGTADKRYALFNLAGGLQLALRIRQDHADKARAAGQTFEGKPAWFNGQPMNFEALPLAVMVDTPNGILSLMRQGKGRYTLSRCLDTLANDCRHGLAAALPWAYLQSAACVLYHLDLTVYDLAAAYLEATNGLVPAPGESGGSVYYPGAEAAPTLDALAGADPNGPAWASVRLPSGHYAAECAVCGNRDNLASPADAPTCPRCAASIWRPAAPDLGPVN